MPLYAYKGIGANGKTTAGVKDADSPKLLRQLMRKEGVVVTEFDISKGGKKGKAGGSGLKKEVNLGDLFGRVGKGEIAAFTRQLATLLRAGIPLAEALGALFEQIENPKFKAIVGEIRLAVNEGSSLADALAKHPVVYDNLYVSMVRAGELAGNLDEVLSRLADFMESAGQLKAKVQSAMIYPVIMALIAVVIIGILMVAVVPKITSVFTQQGKVLPWHTSLLIGLSDFIANYWWLIAGLTAAGIYGFRAWSRSPGGRPVWHQFLLRVPMAGSLIRQLAISRFTRTMGTMLSSGVPMLRALETAKEILGNVILMDAVDRARTAVSEGESLAITLRKSGHFPPTVTHMIAVGERAGELESMLLRVSDAYESQVQTRLDRLTGVLEPLVLVFMGTFVAFVIFSILVPIMDMSSSF
ncbi:MAG: type II secretion system inner membrane protein GspF [Proteobacteria bacterium]|nr:type II secretion system inner membrane protein GspF [Pseudomonadota bacterium]